MAEAGWPQAHHVLYDRSNMAIPYGLLTFRRSYHSYTRNLELYDQVRVICCDRDHRYLTSGSRSRTVRALAQLTS
jgi:hypothetical protein